MSASNREGNRASAGVGEDLAQHGEENGKADGREGRPDEGTLTHGNSPPVVSTAVAGENRGSAPECSDGLLARLAAQGHSLLRDAPPPVVELWTWSTDEERWSSSEMYATREAAIAGALDELDDDRERFWTGRATTPDLLDLAAETLNRLDLCDLITDTLRDNDEVHDWNEDWPEPAVDEERAELYEPIVRHLAAWLAKHRAPKWFTATKVHEHSVADERAAIAKRQTPEVSHG